MANFKLNGVTVATESGGNLTLGSAIVSIPAAGVTGALGSAVELPTGAMIQTVGTKDRNSFYSNSVAATTWIAQTSSFITTKSANSSFMFTFCGDIAPGPVSTTADQNNIVFFASLTDSSTKYNFGWYFTNPWNPGGAAVGATPGDHDWYFLIETDGSTTGAAWRSHNLTQHSFNGNVSSYPKGTALQLNIGLRASNAYIGRHHGSDASGLMGFTYGVSEIKG